MQMQESMQRFLKHSLIGTNVINISKYIEFKYMHIYVCV